MAFGPSGTPTPCGGQGPRFNPSSPKFLDKYDYDFSPNFKSPKSQHYVKSA